MKNSEIIQSMATIAEQIQTQLESLEELNEDFGGNLNSETEQELHEELYRSIHAINQWNETTIYSLNSHIQKVRRRTTERRYRSLDRHCDMELGYEQALYEEFASQALSQGVSPDQIRDEYMRDLPGKTESLTWDIEENVESRRIGG
jgi:uncharacterized protein YPO0396